MRVEQPSERASSSAAPVQAAAAVLKVEEVMSSPVITIDKDRKLSDAIKIMEKSRISRVVVTERGKLYGIVTEKDIARTLGTHKHGKALPASLHVSSAARALPVTIEKSAGIKEAAWLMVEKGILSLPVVDGEKIIGIITATDLLKQLKNSRQKLGKLINRGIVKISADERLVHARRVMLDNKVSRLIVVEGDNVVGILTEKDVGRAFSAFRFNAEKHQYARVRNLLVADVMTQDVKTLSSDASVGEAVKLMLENGFSGVPVVDEGKLVGIVSKAELVKLLA